MKTILIALIFFSSKSFSMTVQEISQLALERSSSISAQEMEAHALKSEAKIQGTWKNPQLMSQLGTFRAGTVEAATTELSLTQAVPLSNKYSLRKELGLIAVAKQKTQNDFFKKWVSHQALLAAWKVYVSYELLQHGNERARRFNLIKKYLETRPKITIKQRVELSIISSQLVQMEKMQDQKKYDFQTAKSDLEFWTGKNIDVAELPFKSLPELKNFPEWNLDITNDVELAQASSNLKISQLDRELAAKERRPDLYLGGGYRVENSSQKLRFTYAIVGIDIPIWDSGSSRVAAAKVRERRDQKYLEETQKKMVLKQQKQIEAVNLSVAHLKRFPKKMIHTQEKTITDAEAGFKQGVLDVNTFLLAETQSHEVIDEVFVSWIGYLENLSTLQLMHGQNFNWEMK